MPISAPTWAISMINAGCRRRTTAGMKKVGVPLYLQRVPIIVCNARRVRVSEMPKRVKAVQSRRTKLCIPFVLIEKATRFIKYTFVLSILLSYEYYQDAKAYRLM